MSAPTHNLDIQSYSYYDIMELFDLSPDNVSLEDLKRAKKRVLMLHPDKSKLPKEYFLFYKKAFDVVLSMYSNVKKVSQKVEQNDYSPEITGTHNPVSNKQFQKSLNAIPQETFQQQFNTMFETHMKKTIDTEKNAWFSQEESLYEDTITNTGQMSAALDRIKQHQQSIVKYQGVNPIQQMSQGNSLYDEDEDEAQYVSSDIFSKLKFDDLRKVHKDQTVFSVRESDYENVPRYRNVQEYQQARSVHEVRPMERTKAQQMIDEQDRLLQEKMKRKQYQSELNTMKNAENNKQIMANFLRLQG
uniref:J domain-containing protein n=1 Tax=viral metagenome TaxID=1070528 RepID=A0A6C0CKP6_9ZZZZ